MVSRQVQTGALRFPHFDPASPLAGSYRDIAIDTLGRVYSYTVIHPNPKSGAQPFALGFVDLPGPLRIMGRIQGDGVAIGRACRAVPDEQFGYVFLLEPQQGPQ